MKRFLHVFLAISLVIAEEIDYHDTLDDNFDFYAISLDEFRAMALCSIDQGPCSDLSASYRKHYPQVVEELCARCNPSQKRTAHVFFQRAKKELPEIYSAFRKLHDPQGKYFDKFEEVLANN